MMQLSEYLIETNEKIGEALLKLEKLKDEKILFVVENDVLRGALTDGDIRRHLLAGGSIDDAVIDAATKTPSSFEGFSEGDARELLREKEIICIPMTVDGKVHTLVFENRTVSADLGGLDIPVIIMAGGFGTRLAPYTDVLPKALMPVGEKTITEHIMDRFKKFGCTDFTFIVNHKKNLIKSYLSEVEDGSFSVSFSDETKPLGTGGGLYKFKGSGIKKAFMTNCDTIVEADYRDIIRRHDESGAVLTIVCSKTKLEVPYGVIETDADGFLTGMKEKPSFDFLMNTGFYVITDEFINEVRDDEFQPMTDIISRCLEKGMRIETYVIESSCFVDIGRPDDLRRVIRKIR